MSARPCASGLEGSRPNREWNPGDDFSPCRTSCGAKADDHRTVSQATWLQAMPYGPDVIHVRMASSAIEWLQRIKSDERSELSFVLSWMEKSATPLPFTSALTMKPLEFSSHCSSPGLPVKWDTNVNF